MKSFVQWLVRWRGGRSMNAGGGRTRWAHPAQVGPGIHRHQRVPDAPDHARQPRQTLWNPPARDKKTAAFTPKSLRLDFLKAGGQNQVSETNQGQSWCFLRPCTKSFYLAIIHFLNGFISTIFSVLESNLHFFPVWGLIVSFYNYNQPFPLDNCFNFIKIHFPSFCCTYCLPSVDSLWE